MLKKLEEKNKLYKKILKTLPDYFAFKNAKGVYEIVSHEVDDIYKDKFPTIEGKSIYQIYTQDEIKDVLALDKEAIDKGETVQSILDTVTDKGTVTLDSIRTPIYDDNGKLMGIVSMSRDISELIHVSERLEEISRIQKIIIDIGKSFVNLSKDSFDDVMESSLGELGKAINADRAYIFEYNFSENTMDNTHEWCNKGIKKEIDNLKGIPVTYYLEGWVNHHLEKETVLIKDMEQEDPDAKLTKVLKPQGIKTCITIPLFIEEECAGFIGFDAVTEKKTLG
jgi:PAS domain S-box-containing protein